MKGQKACGCPENGGQARIRQGISAHSIEHLVSLRGTISWSGVVLVWRRVWIHGLLTNAQGFNKSLGGSDGFDFIRYVLRCLFGYICLPTAVDLSQTCMLPTTGSGLLPSHVLQQSVLPPSLLAI
jgi:hypothetical protein